jgi:hypothetical protein
VPCNSSISDKWYSSLPLSIFIYVLLQFLYLYAYSLSYFIYVQIRYFLSVLFSVSISVLSSSFVYLFLLSLFLKLIIWFYFLPVSFLHASLLLLHFLSVFILIYFFSLASLFVFVLFVSRSQDVAPRCVDTLVPSRELRLRGYLGNGLSSSVCTVLLYNRPCPRAICCSVHTQVKLTVWYKYLLRNLPSVTQRIRW